MLIYLNQLFERGLQYRSINVARSGLSTFLKICSNIEINTHEEVTRFMKGVFQSRPALPRYSKTWDVKIVLNYLEALQNTSLFQISCKIAMLFLLLSAQRCQTLHLIEMGDVEIEENQLRIFPNHLLKQSKPGKHLDVMVFKSIKNEKLCIVKTMLEYLERTEHLRNGTKLFISTIKPHNSVSKDTIARWIKYVMEKAGIGKGFKPHSTRAASTSKAKQSGVTIQTIIKTAGWANAKVFTKHYNMPIVQTDTKTVQEAVLEETE